MSPRYRKKKDEVDRSEETAELTGADAAADEAEFGSAGNGADPFEADLAGTTRRSRSIEEEGDSEDIVPDRIDQYREESSEEEGEEREVTAQPSERPEEDAATAVP